MSEPISLVGTPIGNLGDLSPRAADAFRAADLVACEDTRRTGKLLELVGIARPKLVVMSEYTEDGVVDRLIAAANDGKRVVVVSDAGMPLVSDPGHPLVAAAIRSGVAIDVISGPSAALHALLVSGLPTDRFCFEGFMPRKGSARAASLRALAQEPRTAVIYEAPHRLARTLGDLAAVCGSDRRVAVCRELTKKFEEVLRCTLAEAEALAGEAEPRGEHVIVLGGAAAREATEAELQAALATEVAAGASRRDAVASVADAFGVSRRAVYQLALES